MKCALECAKPCLPFTRSPMHLFLGLAIIEIVAHGRESANQTELGTEIRNSVTGMRRHKSLSCIMYLITILAHKQIVLDANDHRSIEPPVLSQAPRMSRAVDSLRAGDLGPSKHRVRILGVSIRSRLD